MFKKILVTIDGSDPSKLAVDLGVGIAERDGAELVVLTVVPPVPLFLAEDGELPYYPRLIDDLEQYHKKLLFEAGQALLAHGGLNVTTVLRKGNPAMNIVEAAREEGVDLIVLGNRGTGGILSWMLGSTSRNVAEACTVPVLIVKDREYCEV